MRYPVFALALLGAVLAASLACAKPSAYPVRVEVPVPVPCPPPTIPARPKLPSAQLPEAPALSDLVKALLGDREALAAWALDLEQRLKAYQPTSPKDAK